MARIIKGKDMERGPWLRVAASTVAVIFVIACGDVGSNGEWTVESKSRSAHSQTREITYFVKCRNTDSKETKTVTVSKVRWEQVEAGQPCPR